MGKREIKFRFWDADEKIFHFGNLYELKYGYVDALLPECPAMQFTGLLDKNGKEIYEGDIFRFTKHPGYLLETFISKIIFIDEWACFGYVVGNDLLGTRDVPFSEHDDLQTDILDHLEIIGNIYEHHSLLSVENDGKII